MRRGPRRSFSAPARARNGWPSSRKPAFRPAGSPPGDDGGRCLALTLDIGEGPRAQEHRAYPRPREAEPPKGNGFRRCRSPGIFDIEPFVGVEAQERAGPTRNYDLSRRGERDGFREVESIPASA